MSSGASFFHDRRDAGRRLAEAVRSYAGADTVVLALPRGGVPVAAEVARALDAPMDVLLVRKIGAPGHEEFALGAVIDGADPQLVLNEDVIKYVRPPAGYIEAAQKRQLAEIERRRKLYRDDEPALELNGRTVIVVDDGIATGATIRAALRGLRRTRPRRLVLAVPVAPSDAVASLAAECDEVVCLSTPADFRAVGLHYEDFEQTSDEEVVSLLAEARRRSAAKRTAARPEPH
jgi:putative phosphoribosyl transferase